MVMMVMVVFDDMVLDMVLVVMVMHPASDLRELLLSQIGQDNILSFGCLLKNGEHCSLLSKLKVHM
jgi:hypothetical protein